MKKKPQPTSKFRQTGKVATFEIPVKIYDDEKRKLINGAPVEFVINKNTGKVGVVTVDDPMLREYLKVGTRRQTLIKKGEEHARKRLLESKNRRTVVLDPKRSLILAKNPLTGTYIPAFLVEVGRQPTEKFRLSATDWATVRKNLALETQKRKRTSASHSSLAG